MTPNSTNNNATSHVYSNLDSNSNPRLPIGAFSGRVVCFPPGSGRIQYCASGSFECFEVLTDGEDAGMTVSVSDGWLIGG